MSEYKYVLEKVKELVESSNQLDKMINPIHLNKLLNDWSCEYKTKKVPLPPKGPEPISKSWWHR